MDEDFSIFSRLTEVLRDRNRQRPAGSYSASLFSGGIGRIGAKLREEAVEATEAAAESETAGGENLVHEAADLVFHLMVLLEMRGASMSDVAAELRRREGTGGLDEKDSRGTRH